MVISAATSRCLTGQLSPSRLTQTAYDPRRAFLTALLASHYRAGPICREEVLSRTMFMPG